MAAMLPTSSYPLQRSKHSVSSNTHSESMVNPKESLVPPTAQHKSFYGQESIARLCARFITHLFGCPERPPNHYGWQVELPYYIAYAVYRTKLPTGVVFAALALLQRLKSRFPSAKGSSGHRLFISAFMIASKVMCDDTYSNKSWSVVAQAMFTVREVNQMEREMCGYLDWELNVDGDILASFQEKVLQDFTPLNGPYPNYSLQDVSRRAAKAAASKSSTPVSAQTSPSPSKIIPTAAASVSSSSSPDKLCISTNTPSPTYSDISSPASSISPQTPIGHEDFYAQIQDYTTSPPAFSIRENAGWPVNHPLKNDVFARAVPSEW